MGNYAIGATVIGIAAIFLLYRTLGGASELRERCVTEWEQLQIHLKQRHLILSHLLDSVSSRHLDSTTREEIIAAMEQSTSALDRVDANAIGASDQIRQLAACEQELQQLLRPLIRQLELQYVHAEGKLNDPISACLNGLRQTDRQVNHALSTYNASVITYISYVNSRRTLRPRSQSDESFAVIDLENDSSDSRIDE